MTKYSYSRVSTFKTCPYLYKLRYVDRLSTYPSDDAANALYLGSAMHTGLEKDVAHALEQYFGYYNVISDANINEAIKLEYIITLVKKLKILPEGEYEMKLETEDFIGFMDLLVPKGDNHFDIYDFKYSNKVDNYLKSSQLHLYKYYYEMTHPGHVIDNLYYVFLPKTLIRQKKTEDLYQFRKRIISELSKLAVKIISVDYDSEMVRAYHADVSTVEAATEYPKCESGLCRFCEFQTYCEKGDTTMLLPKNERRTIGAVEKKVIWLYGAPFSGKTYLADKFADPLMLNTDGNVRFVTAPSLAIKDIVTVDGRITKRKRAWEVFKEAITELEKKQNSFKTIVVDLLEDTYEHCRAYEYEQLGIDHESDAGFGKGYDIIRKEFLDTIKRITMLDYENIILISHEDSSRNITSKGGSSLTTIRPNIQDKIASKVAGMVDIVGRVVANGNERKLSFRADEFVFGGGRLNNVKGKEIPLTYDALMQVYADANAPVTRRTEIK